MIMDEDKKQMIEKIKEALQTEAEFIRQDETMSKQTKLSRVDVILDVFHFLNDYERNVKVLTEYNAEHKFEIQKENEKSSRERE